MPFLDSIKSSERLVQNAGEVLIQLIDYDVDGNAVYIGVNSIPSSSIEEATWVIKKLVWADGNLVKSEFKENVAWIQRAILSWNV